MEPEKPTPNKEEVGAILKPLRTYERDIADMIRAHQTSEVAVNLAKQKKEEQKPEIKIAEEKKKFVLSTPKDRVNHNKLYTRLSILFIFVGITMLVAIYFIKSSEPKIKIPEPVINTFIPNKEERVLALEKISQTQIAENFSALLKEALPDDSITYIKITMKGASSTVDADPETFFKSGFKNIPASLTRSFDKKMFSGIYTREINHPFFIVQIDSFDKAFEGMLAWEKNMYTDIKPFWKGNSTNNESEIITQPLENFDDLILQNKDTRVLKNNQGETLIIYSFIDQKTLFIVDSEITFKEVLNRFTTSKFIR